MKNSCQVAIIAFFKILSSIKTKRLAPTHHLPSMAATVTLPLIGYTISINSLIAIVLLLCLFFTFFSVSITFANLDPGIQQKRKQKHSCSHSDGYYQNAEVQLAQDVNDQLHSLRSAITQQV